VLGSGAQGPGEGVGAELTRQFWGALQSGFTPGDVSWDTATGAFLNAVLRDESGAAVPETEYPRYRAALIPSPNDPPETRALKEQMRNVAIQARVKGLSMDQTFAALSQISGTDLRPSRYAQVAPIQDDVSAGPLQGGDQATAPAPAPAPNSGATGARRLKFNPATGRVE
jgi:hypothetical protein